MGMQIIDGGICAVEGVKAAGACQDEYGVAVILFPESTAAAVFTTNQVVAAPVTLSRKAIESGKLSAIIANSGNANCFTGKTGLKNAQIMVKQVAEYAKIPSEDVAVASTGIIGRELPMDIIKKLTQEALERLDNTGKSSKNAAEAIMTTDTFPKEFAVKTTLKNGDTVTIGGITKGSGMIAPNMATMLCFITTDVQATPHELHTALKKAVDKTFNLLVVDGDESTNDTVIILSNGRSGPIDDNFQKALEYLCQQLARMMARDGEGATKLMEVEVKGASTEQDARMASKTIVTSPLVKTALFGADPNWGRIIAAVGYSGAMMKEELISVALESGPHRVDIVKLGEVKAFEGTFELELAEQIMKEEEIKIIVDLGLGDYEATSYGCDLTYDYVRINAEYST